MSAEVQSQHHETLAACFPAELLVPGGLAPGSMADNEPRCTRSHIVAWLVRRTRIADSLSGLGSLLGLMDSLLGLTDNLPGFGGDPLCGQVEVGGQLQVGRCSGLAR